MDIVINSLKKCFKNKEVLIDVNFVLMPGKIVGLIGDNGSGKTTIMKILSGLYEYDSGTIENIPYKGKIIDVANLIEAPAFISTMTVRQNLKYFIDLKIENDDDFVYYCNLFDIDFLDIKYGKLSLGMKQKVAILYLFLKKAKLLLIDEITNGLDERFVSTFYNELKDYVNKYNTYVLISSHKISELLFQALHSWVVPP